MVHGGVEETAQGGGAKPPLVKHHTRGSRGRVVLMCRVGVRGVSSRWSGEGSLRRRC